MRADPGWLHSPDCAVWKQALGRSLQGVPPYHRGMAATVPAHHLRIVLDTAASKGANARELCASVGLDPALLEDPEARTPAAVASALYEEAAAQTGDGAFGLHVAERSDFFAFDALGFAIAAKKNLSEAFAHLGPAISALHGTRMELDVVGSAAHLSFELPEEAGQLCRHRAEAYTARVVRMFVLATGVGLRPRRVSLRHDRPENVSEHERVFAAPLAFNVPRHEIVFDAVLLDVPLVRADPRLSEVLDRQCGISWPGCQPSNRFRIRSGVTSVTPSLAESSTSTRSEGAWGWAAERCSAACVARGT